MKIYHSLLCITAILTGNLIADTIILKTGIKYEGKIISTDKNSYLVEIHYSKSIKDERRIPKDQVQEIIKAAKDAEDIANVKALVPTPDRLTEEAYKKRIKTASNFLTKYPKSVHSKEVKTILETLKKEHQVICKGGIKLGGQLISSSDIEANAYDIHARMLFDDIKKLATNRRHQPALRKWETLQNTYSHSTSYRDSMTLASRMLHAHSSELKNYLDTLESREAKRKSTLENLNEDDRARTIAVLTENKNNYETLIKKELTQLRTKWLTVNSYHKKALDYNLRNTVTGLKFVSSYDTSKFKPAGPTYRGAWAALAKDNLVDAANLIQKLKSLRLPDRYTDPLTQRLEEKQTAQQNTEKQTAKDLAEQKLLAAEAAKAAAEKAKQESMKKKKK
jgi:small nuclear ribonucleoprotein (snRNP)-like protein